MATPEFISLQCDHCGGALSYDACLRTNWITVQPNDGYAPFMFENHSQAYAAGRKAGWYIAELELCPEHAEAYAIEKASQEVEP